MAKRLNSSNLPMKYGTTRTQLWLLANVFLETDAKLFTR